MIKTNSKKNFSNCLAKRWSNSSEFSDSENKPVIGLVPVMGYLNPPTSSINLYVKSISPLPLTVTLLVPLVVLIRLHSPARGFYRKRTVKSVIKTATITGLDLLRPTHKVEYIQRVLEINIIVYLNR